MSFPDKKYNIIYADPAWKYEDKASAGQRGACYKYDVMELVEIMSLPIPNIAAKDCCLFLWVTMPKLDEVFKLFEAWGFTYKTCAFTWVKTNPNSFGFFMGMGRWTRANAELCLLATKGQPQRKNAGISQIIFSAVQEHSRKPAIIRDRIVQLCGDLPRIELFARQRVEGWDAWGNEL